MKNKLAIMGDISAMRQLFPEAFKEGKIDFAVLRQLLGDFVDNEEERHSFKWSGKDQHQGSTEIGKAEREQLCLRVRREQNMMDELRQQATKIISKMSDEDLAAFMPLRFA